MNVKQVQIDENLFYDLARFHLLGQQNEELERRIGAGLELKLQKLSARQQYTERLKAEGMARKQSSPE